MKTSQPYGWSNTKPRYAQPYLQPAIEDILRRHATTKVIDIGCGNGVTIKALSDAGYAATGCEPDLAGFEIARQHAPKSDVFNLGVYDDPEKVKTRPFDAAISMEVIEHLFDPPRLFAFARDVLVPSGLLVVSTPYHGYLKNVALSVCGKWDHHHHPARVGGHVKFWSRATLTGMFEQLGFDVLEFHGAGRMRYFWKSMIVVGKKK